MNRTLPGLIGLLLSFTAESQIVSGQKATEIHPAAQEIKYEPGSKAPRYISFYSDKAPASAQVMNVLTSVLSLRAEDRLIPLRSERDEIGMEHSRYRQTYKGVNVYTGEYIVHSRNGRIESANGFFADGINLSVSPVVTESTALKTAMNVTGIDNYNWDAHAGSMKVIRGDDGKPNGVLVILPYIPGGKTGSAVLAWMFDLHTADPHGRWFVYIDAQTGKLLYKENRICTFAANGSGTTKYSGTQAFKTDSIAPSNFRLRDYTRAAGVETYDMNTGTNYGAAVDFTDTDNIWTTTTNQDNAALDAHWGTQKTYDYYLSVHNRNSYDNAGSALRSYVHFSSGYNNAFWDGFVMTYGDGNGSGFSPLTELDIVGHELTHGVTEYSSNLVYSFESGALNESFSDIFGVTIDFFTKPGTANWLVGDQCYTPGTPGDALRYMNNPNLGFNPDTYLGTHWYAGAADNGGVHTNSGVQNFWYYLLVNGGSGTNDGGFAYNVTGIGLTNARLIAYRNNSFYLTSGSQYADAAFYALKSANDLFGSCSPQAVAVKNAWDAVGVYGLQLNQNAAATVSGATCTGSTVQLNATGGTNYQWSGPNSFSSTLANPTISNASAVNNGTYTVIVTDASGCSGTATVAVNLLPSPLVTASGGGQTCPGNSRQLNAAASVQGQGGNTAGNSTPLAIPDAPSPGVSSSVTISGSISASNVVFCRIDSLIHTWDGDLRIELIAPNGSRIILANNVGGSGQNFINTTFSPSAATPIANGAAPFNGSYLPSQPFSNLNGPANGTWQLKLTDLGGQDVGTLYKWTLQLAPNVITSYNWNPASGLNNASVSNPVATPASSTTYIVTVTDLAGCTASSSTIVSISDVTAISSATNATCGSNNGSATVNVTGATLPVTYLWSNGATTQSISNLAAASYTVTVTDANGCTDSDIAVVGTSGGSSSAPGTIAGPAGVCRNQTGIVFSVAPVSGATSYNWILPNGMTGASTTNSITVNISSTYTAGTLCVSANSACGTSATSCRQVAYFTARPPTPVITGANIACKNSTVVFNANPLPTALVYTWTAPANATIVSGQGTPTVTVSFSNSWTTGNLLVNASNCIGTSSNRSFKLYSSPGTPATITGNRFAACAGSVQTYSVPAVAAASVYNWTIPAGASIINGQGTNSISVQLPVPFSTGVVSVAAANSCGASAARTLSIRSTAAMPANITGPVNNLCGATNVTYSIPVSTTGATSYNWTVPPFATIVSGQGTTSIVVNYASSNGSGGFICVTADNACGSSPARCLSNVTTLPFRPAAINGSSSVCANQAGVQFSVPVQPGVTYNWSVPASASIVSGQGTGSITVNWGASGGTVTVIATNSCGNALSRTRSVAVTCRMSELSATNVSVYPNPASSSCLLTFDGEPGTYNVSIFDVLGKELISTVSSEQQLHLNISSYPSGLYFVRVKSDEGLDKVMRLIVE